MEHTPIRAHTKGSRPKTAQQKMVGFRLTEDELMRCQSYADEQVRSVSSFIRMLALRGLVAYETEHRQPKSRRR